MSSTFEETVLDFDINFLHPSNNVVNECRTDKQRKAIVIAKRKIIATDSLIRKYYGNKEKLDQTEVALLAAKEECKQVCLDYRDALDKCTQLEKDFNIQKIKNAELDGKYKFTQNQHEAMKSHANQLQLLIKGHESIIEALKIEKALEKNSSEDYEKDLSSIQKENKLLLGHLSLIKDIALGKKKLRQRHKLILKKYENLTHISSSDDDSSSESNFEEPDFLVDNPHIPPFASPEDTAGNENENTVTKPNKTETNVKEDISRFNEDNSDNEVVSEDTGRGSSLAFSDGEKCFNSPDYYNTNSPITSEIDKNKDKATRTNSGTKSNRNCEVIHVATSPIIFDDELLLSDSNLLFSDETVTNNLEYYITDIPLSDDVVTIKEKKKVVDIGTSPIKEIERVNIATSPLIFIESALESSNSVLNTTVKDSNTNVVNNSLSDINSSKSCQKSSWTLIGNTVSDIIGKHTKIANLASHCELEIKGNSIEEMKCLDRNNSNNLCNENSNDSEIETILNTMRLTQRLITPIPKTPVKPSVSESRNTQAINEVSDSPKKHIICQDALKVRRQYKVLQKSLDDLKKQVMKIENHMLKDKPVQKISNNSDNGQSIDLLEDTSQETILIGTNDQNSSIQVEANKIPNLDFSKALQNKIVSTSIIEKDKDETTNNNNLQNDLLSRCNISEQKIESSFSPIQDTFDESIEISKDIDKETSTSLSVKNFEQSPMIDSREAITFEDDCISEEENDIILNNAMNHTVNDLSKDCNKNKVMKCKKLSKLNKFKRKLLPRSKISSVKVPIKKIRPKSKLIPVLGKNSHTDAITILNNKSVYENAAKIMAEIKSKESNSIQEGNVPKKAKKIVLHEKEESSTQVNTDLISNKQIYNVKDINNLYNPVVCLSHLKLDVVHSKLLEPNQLISLHDSFSPTTKTCENKKYNNNECVSPIQRDTKDKTTENFEAERKNLKRGATDIPFVVPKRILRSSSNREAILDNPDENVSSVHSRNKTGKSKLFNDENNQHNRINNIQTNRYTSSEILKQKLCNIENEKQNRYNIMNAVSDSRNKIPDLEMSRTEIEKQNRLQDICESDPESESDVPLNKLNRHPKKSILCTMLEKHGRSGKSSTKKVPETISNSICKTLEVNIAMINDLPVGKANPSMNKLVEDIQGLSERNFLSGFMKYLKDPARKRELFNKVNTPPAPPMSKSEQVLLYLVRQMQMRKPNTVNVILTHIEFSLFQINRTPEFDIIESLSHFYALLCRYFGLKSRLRLFILDAMYCLQFKVVPLIKQCLDVWMHILPLAHMGIAKSPLVTCLVYLLHFYKCEDRFNRVQEIRSILNRKYFYQITDWNESKILELFKNAIKEIRDIPIEKKMLKMALIILGKRQGPKWCHKNIIKSMLMPTIESENVSVTIKQFCVQMLGALLKPFPADMKVHFEIAINHLHDMLDQNPSDTMKEAIFTSLIYINHHNPNRVIQSLLTWMPQRVSPEFEALLRDYVRGKPLFAWKKILSRVTM